MVVVVGGGILTEDTIWAFSKGISGFVKDAKNLLSVVGVNVLLKY